MSALNLDEVKVLLKRLQAFVDAIDNLVMDEENLNLDIKYKHGEAEIERSRAEYESSVTQATLLLLPISDYAGLTGYVTNAGEGLLARLQAAWEAAKKAQEEVE